MLPDDARILGIETSCDDTSAAVLEAGTRIRSNVVASQINVHRPYGGVVPELASRQHILSIGPVVEEALAKASVGWEGIHALSVTQGPGLIGSLLVGVSVAKAIAYARRLPLIGVNHLEGHLRSNFLVDPSIPLPAVSLVVSGGHTSLYELREEGRYHRVARTRDDAAGEAFDKVAKLLGLGYPGGPVIDRLAERGDAAAVRFPPVKMSDGSLDFSFSGLKTAAVRFIEQHGLAAEAPTAGPAEPPPVVLDLCASFRRAVVAALAERAFRVARKLQARAVCVAGGVACNLELRRRFAREAGALGILSHFPPPSLSTDNAAMIAAAGWLHLRRGRTSGLDLTADPDLEL
ncbi:MAG: tRNA (adenosine(37)-N6)-threonylcarbamoyltransferase complex transferase subunit TsaD [Acidobacteriota bacterium]